jgi:type IV pilus assembly protein PilC
MNISHDQLRWMEQLAELSQSGMPLPEGLRSAAEESSRGLARQLRRLATDLESGVSWEEVLGNENHGLSPHVMELIRAGLRSGNLGEALNGLVDHHRQRRDVWRQLVSAMAYPLVVFGLGVFLLLFVLLYLVTAMAETFADFGTELPALTMFWINLARVFPPLFFCCVFGFPILLLLVRIFGGAVGWNRFVASIPMFGPMLHWASVAEMIRLLQICTIQEVRLPEALRLTAGAVGNANMSQVSNWLADGTERGVPLAKMLDATPRIPNFIVPVIRWGEQQNALEEALANVLKC